MQESRALALIPTGDQLTGMTTMAKAMQESGYWPDLKSAGQALVKIQAGREYGYGPFEAMLAIQIVQGKPTLTAQAIASRIKGSGKYNYRVREHTAQACEIEFYEGQTSVGTSRFTIEDAQKASLTGKQVWQAYPKNMLFARAISNGAKWYAPDVFGAAPPYTAEELGAEVNETGEVITTTVRVVEAPQRKIEQAFKPEPPNASEPPIDMPAEQPFTPAPPLCTQPQIRAIYALAKQLGLTEEQLDTEVEQRFEKDTQHISKTQASDLIAGMQAEIRGRAKS